MGPPTGAPNVVIVLIDDIGFGASSAFGGPIQMPTLDKMATAGLRYNRFHTTALCSPTRTALLTGHNHHANNAGAIMELATAFPGNTGNGMVMHWPKGIKAKGEIRSQFHHVVDVAPTALEATEIPQPQPHCH